jgi:type IV pilus assembly protein PilN
MITTRINLLPWRAQARQERQQEFVNVLVVGLVVALIVLGLVYFTINQMIDNQKSRNQYLSQQIVLLDKKIKEIKNLQQQRKELVARMNVIEKLQADRNNSVQIFDELVHIIPDAIYLGQISKQGDLIMVTGVADSNATVSRFMHNIELSRWLANPTLKEVVTKQGKTEKTRTFAITMTTKQLKTTAQANQEDF